MFSFILLVSLTSVSFFQSLTAENIPSGDSRVWAVLIGDLVLLVGVFAYFGFGVSLYRKKVGYQPWLGTSVLVERVSRDVADSTLLERYVQQMFPETNVTATIIPGCWESPSFFSFSNRLHSSKTDLREFAKLMEKQEIYNKKIADYTNKFEATGVRTLSPLDSIRNFASPWTNATDFFVEKLAETENKIEDVCSQPLQVCHLAPSISD